MKAEFYFCAFNVSSCRMTYALGRKYRLHVYQSILTCDYYTSLNRFKGSENILPPSNSKQPFIKASTKWQSYAEIAIKTQIESRKSLNGIFVD